MDLTSYFDLTTFTIASAGAVTHEVVYIYTYIREKITSLSPDGKSDGKIIRYVSDPRFLVWLVVFVIFSGIGTNFLMGGEAGDARLIFAAGAGFPYLLRLAVKGIAPDIAYKGTIEPGGEKLGGEERGVDDDKAHKYERQTFRSAFKLYLG